MNKVISLFKKILKIILDFFFQKTNFVLSGDDVLVTSDHKLFNSKGVQKWEHTQVNIQGKK